MTAPPVADVLVVGAGPAGRSLARAAARHDLRVLLVDPHPHRPWRNTYGAWTHELPADLPPAVVAARGRGIAIARRTHELDEQYAVLDTAALQAHLTDPAVAVRTARVTGVGPGPTVTLDDGTSLPARLVVDATGARQLLSTSRPGSLRAEQTAYGVVVGRETAAAVTGDRLVFMDWRPRHGHGGWPTFLYAVPLDDDRVLLEETSLVRRPGLPLAELRTRLHARLAAAGVGAGPDAVVEKVRFPVDTPPHRSPAGVVAIGAAAPVMHPASGFSLATSLRLAPCLAATIAGALRAGTDPAAAARRTVRSPAAVTVDAMRRRGLAVLLALPPAEVPEFFERFFDLSPACRRAYLDARDDVGASLTAMLALFARLSPRLRGHLIRGTLGGPGGVRTDQ